MQSEAKRAKLSLRCQPKIWQAWALGTLKPKPAALGNVFCVECGFGDVAKGRGGILGREERGRGRNEV